MGATDQVDRWECPTKPERTISTSALVNDHPPPVWRVVIIRDGKTQRVRVVALTEMDAEERVKKEMPGSVIVLVELISQMR